MYSVFFTFILLEIAIYLYCFAILIYKNESAILPKNI